MSAATGMRPAAWLERLRRRTSENGGRIAPETFGRLSGVNGDRLEVSGRRLPLGTRCDIELKPGEYAAAEVIGFGHETTRLLTLDDAGKVEPGAKVFARMNDDRIDVTESLLGRVLDGLGRPLDEGRPVPFVSNGQGARPGAPNPLKRQRITEKLDVGVRAINGLLSLGLGQRVGLFAPSGVGKSVLLGMMARHTEAEVVVVGLVGERGREVRDFIADNLGPAGLAKSLVFAAPAGSSALLRVKAAEQTIDAASAYAARGHRVLVLMDSLTRLAEAGREIALAAGELPAARGFPPSVFSRLTRLVERTGAPAEGHGSMSAVFTVLTQDEMQTDPVAESARAVLDGHLVLSQELAAQGIYPAIDIAASISRVADRVTSVDHQQRARRFRQLYDRYMQSRELIAAGAYTPGMDGLLDEAIARFPAIAAYLQQAPDLEVPFERSVQELESLFGAAMSAGSPEAAQEPGPAATMTQGGQAPGQAPPAQPSVPASSPPGAAPGTHPAAPSAGGRGNMVASTRVQAPA